MGLVLLLIYSLLPKSLLNYVIDVLFIPKIRNNFVSGGCLNCVGYKQVYIADMYILSWCGMFIDFDGIVRKNVPFKCGNTLSVAKNLAFISSSLY